MRRPWKFTRPKNAPDGYYLVEVRDTGLDLGAVQKLDNPISRFGGVIYSWRWCYGHKWLDFRTREDAASTAYHRIVKGGAD